MKKHQFHADFLFTESRIYMHIIYISMYIPSHDQPAGLFILLVLLSDQVTPLLQCLLHTNMLNEVHLNPHEIPPFSLVPVA